MINYIDRFAEKSSMKLSRIIRKGRLNITSAYFATVSFFICMIIPFGMFMFLGPSENIVKMSVTVIFPTFVNILIIPMFKIVSFYQEIDETWLSNIDNYSEKKNLKEKQIIWTEAILMISSSLPIALWYILIGFEQIFQTYPIISQILFLLALLLVIFVSILIIGLYLFKITKSIVTKLLGLLKQKP